MVAVDTTKNVLRAVAEALPSDGEDVLTKVEIHDGWGGILNVRLHATGSRHESDRALVQRIRKMVAEAVGTRRHHVDVVWNWPP